jgi:rod shape-determining protein MreC
LGFWGKFKFPIITAALLLTGLSLFSLYASKDPAANPLDRLVLEIVGPVQEAVTGVGDAFSRVWRRYFALVRASQKNEELKEQVAVLRGQLVRLRELEKENHRLRELLEIEPTIHYPLIAAEVVGMDPSNYFRTATLNKGRMDGVSSHMPVVDSRGVVGRIIWVSNHYSKVLFLTDPNSGLDVMIQRTRARGVVQGVAKDRLKMKYLLHTLEVVPGDFIVTSGAAGVFPQGILVGEVVSVEKDGEGVFQSIEVAPAADFERLEEVLIILQRRRIDATKR